MSKSYIIQLSKQKFMQVNLTSFFEKMKGCELEKGHLLGLKQYTFCFVSGLGVYHKILFPVK